MYDLIVIGAGPAGLAAAIEAYESGLKNVLLIDRDQELGGILNQCIHNGFGLHRFKEELTGPQFAQRYIHRLQQTNVEVLLDTMVLEINDKREVYISNTQGYQCLQAKSIILAMGCRERSRGAIMTPGDRGAGVFTAGTAQRYVNMDGYCVGKRVVILGSGDIGLIMARRMTLEGAKVLACVEINPYSSGLARNIKQCLEDFDIPLYLSHTITKIEGYPRVEKVTVMHVDEHFQPIPYTQIEFDCDTVLLSIGLVPENELSKQAGIEMDPRTRGPMVFENMETSISGIFACGNVVQVHDLADHVTVEAQKAARGVYAYVQNQSKFDQMMEIRVEEGVSYTVPQRIHMPCMDKVVELSFRTKKVFGPCKVQVMDRHHEIIAQSKRECIVPAELQKIMIPTERLQIQNAPLTVCIKELQDD